MIRRLLIASTAILMTLTTPLVATANEVDMPAIEQAVDEEATIAVNGQSVIVANAQGQTLEVVSLTGRRVLTVKIDSPAQRIELNIPKGCYILKVGKVVRKVSVH